MDMMWKEERGNIMPIVEGFMVFVEIAVEPVKEIKVAIAERDTLGVLYNEDLRKRNTEWYS